MAKFSRTVNPLHFEDLEPHRFEDLVRQLVYDFRTWHSIEATGRLGADEGVDIRAIERFPTAANSSVDSAEEDTEGQSGPAYKERVWMIQCKREKSVGPTKIREIIAAAISDKTPIPFGFIIAVACDVSHKTREILRLEMNRLGIEELFLWGKSELEDMLFLPKNDHLLFAYFGLSLQVRRRSERTTLNSRLAIKRKLVTVLESLTGPFHTPVLLRDSAASEYPRHEKSVVFGETERWRYFRFAGHLRPDHIALIAHEYWAWAKFEVQEWDSIPDFDQAWIHHPRMLGVPGDFPGRSDKEETARRYWLTQVPKRERAHYRVLGFIQYDRILAVDDIGDHYHEPPHIIVDCANSKGFFGDDFRDIIVGEERWERQMLFADDSKRRALFPKVIPEMPDEEFHKALGIESRA